MQPLPDGYFLAAATPADLPTLVEVDKAAGMLFADTGLLSEDALNDHVPAEVFEHAIEDSNVITVRHEEDDLIGFALVSLRGGTLYLDQISVHPSHGRKGLGGRLLDWVIDLAKRRGLRRVTLSTFRDLPWNGPFYAKYGFQEIARPKLADWMLELERIQAADLDISKRCFMMRKIGWL